MTVFTTVRGADAPLVPSALPPARPATQPLESEVSVRVDPGRAHQTVLGIGAAITDAAADTFAALSPPMQRRLLRAVFDPQEGAGYSLLRTTVHSCDFSAASYTYVDDDDLTLDSFDVAPDRRARLPMIRAALAAARAGVTVYASPWSAPGWMKDTGSMLQGGRLRPESAPLWARYLARFVQAYAAEGVPLWGLTVQNEPMARQRWESMLYTAEEERDFLKHHLVPALQAAGLGHLALIVWDHNRDLIAHRAGVILSDPQAARHVWGVGFHWYETWAGGEPMHDNVAAVHADWPGVNLLMTEACVERFEPGVGREWPNAERYARQMIADFNAGAVGWTDWNLLLDERGGPNHVGNFCHAPVHADLRTGELRFTPSFAVISHFSKFVRPGAHRLSTSCSRSTVRAAAFRNLDGRIVVVVFHPGEEALDLTLQVGDTQRGLTLPPQSIQTFVLG